MTSPMSLEVAQMSTTEDGTISAGQDLWLIGPDDMTVPLTCGLHYSCEDPYAVRMSLDTGTDKPVQWFISRDLLAAAMFAPEGIGDVRAWPSPAERVASTGTKTLNIELGPPDGYVHFEVSAAGVAAFLARTYELVPGGQEAAFLNLDTELTELLNQA
jgi:Streptomyces sporulation and cell division protein, SsgA